MYGIYKLLKTMESIKIASNPLKSFIKKIPFAPLTLTVIQISIICLDSGEITTYRNVYSLCDYRVHFRFLQSLYHELVTMNPVDNIFCWYFRSHFPNSLKNKKKIVLNTLLKWMSWITFRFIKALRVARNFLDLQVTFRLP